MKGLQDLDFAYLNVLKHFFHRWRTLVNFKEG